MASNKGGAGVVVAAFGALVMVAGVGAGVFVMQAEQQQEAVTESKEDKKRDRKAAKRAKKKAAAKAREEKAKKKAAAKAKKKATKKSGAAETKLVYPALEGAPIRGSASAVVTVVHFGDFASPESRKATAALRDVTQRLGTKVRVAYRHRPLEKNRGARGAALSGIAAHRQDKFWPYHDELVRNPGELRREDLERIAKKSGLDFKVYKDALASSNTIIALENDGKAAEKLDVSVVPTFFVNGERLAGETDAGALKAAIDRAIERARPRTDEGLSGDALYQKLAKGGSAGGSAPSQVPPSSPGH